MSLLPGRVTLLALLLLVPGAAAPALAVDLSAYWEYREVGGDNIDTRSDFQQRYSLGLGPGVTYQLTPAISLGAGFGYNRTQRDAGDDQGMQTVEEFTPSAQLTLTNDIFTASLAGTITEFRPDDGEDYSTDSWDATLSSNWQSDLWPSVRFNYGETTESGSGGDVEANTTRYSANLYWEVGSNTFYYDYSHSEIEETVSESFTESDTHLLRYETFQSFWQKRINLSFSQQYQHTKTDGVTRTEFNVLSQTSEISDPPDEINLETNAALNDGIFNEEAETVESGQRIHLGIDFFSSDKVQTLEIYLDQFKSLTQNEASQIEWFFYRRIDFDIDVGSRWEKIEVSVPVFYDITQSNRKFVISVPDIVQSGTGLMVVGTNPLSNPEFIITEAEAYGIPVTDEQMQQFLTNVNLRIQLTPTLSATSNLVLEKSKSEPEGEIETETTRRTLSGSLRWSPSPYVSPSINYSETRDEVSGSFDSEQVNRAYSLIVATYPLPTLNVTFGATRTDRFSDGFKTSTSDNFSVTTTARIYPDLTANLNLNYILRDRMEEDAPTASGETFTSRFTLNARLSPKLTADLTVNYRDTESESFREVIDPDTDLPQWVKTTTSTTGTDSTLSLLYRPSDLLSVRATSTNYWSGTDREDLLAFNVNLALLRTRNTRLTFIYTRSQAEVTSNNYRLDGSWDISRYLALQAQFNYRSTEGVDTWGTLAQLSLRL